MRTLERNIQTKLINALRADGWIVNKPTGNSLNGWPDVQAYRDGKCVFIEVKAPGNKPRKLQQFRLLQLANAGFDCFVWDGKEDLKKFLKQI